MSAAINNVSVNWIPPEELYGSLISTSKTAFESSMLRLSETLAGNSLPLDINLVNFITDYFIEMVPQLTYWYTALERLDLLPPLVPALPDHFFDFYLDNCPIMKMGHRLKENGEPYKVFETHSLYLIPPNSLDDMSARVRSTRRKGSYTLDWWYFSNTHIASDQEQVKKTGLHSRYWEWILISNDVIEESRNKWYKVQEEIIEKLNNESGTDYKVGTLKEIGAFLLLHRVATDVILYQASDIGRGYNSSYSRHSTSSRVQDINMFENHLIIGASYPWTVQIDTEQDYSCKDGIGIAAVQKFTQPFGDLELVFGPPSSKCCSII